VRSDAEALAAAVRLAAVRRPDGAAATLLDLLPGAEPELAVEIRAALAALAVGRREGPEAALLLAVNDKDEVRRAAPPAPLGEDDGAYLKSAGRPLFLPGAVQALQRVGYRGSEKRGDLRVVELRFYNRIDDKQFAGP